MGWVSSLPVPSLAQAPFLPGPTLFPPPPPQGSSASRNLVGGGCRGPYWATGRGQPREVTKPWIKGRKAGAGSRALVCWSLLRTPDMKLILSALLSLWVLGECRYPGECPPPSVLVPASLQAGVGAMVVAPHRVGAMSLRPSVWARRSLPAAGLAPSACSPEGTRAWGQIPPTSLGSSWSARSEACGRKPRAPSLPHTSSPFVLPVALFHAVYMGGR